VIEARPKPSETGLVVEDEGWFVLNAREARWYRAEGRGAAADLEGETEFAQLGINLFVLWPGESIGMYHWEANQEDFLVLSGEALLLIEDEERQLRRWDFVHCPRDTNHIILGAGAGPCAVLAIGARRDLAGEAWGGYPVDELARRHGVSVEVETSDADVAYADVPRRKPTAYEPGWLPD